MKPRQTRPFPNPHHRILVLHGSSVAYFFPGAQCLVPLTSQLAHELRDGLDIVGELVALEPRKLNAYDLEGFRSWTVLGNQTDPAGNPIPYHRATQRSKWSPGHKRYTAWKKHVALALLESAKAGRWWPEDELTRIALAVMRNQKPLLATGRKVRVDTMIWFANKAHGDSENVRKGVIDALLADDKLVVGSHDFGYDPNQPRVEVKLWLS